MPKITVKNRKTGKKSPMRSMELKAQSNLSKRAEEGKSLGKFEGTKRGEKIRRLTAKIVKKRSDVDQVKSISRGNK